MAKDTSSAHKLFEAKAVCDDVVANFIKTEDTRIKATAQSHSYILEDALNKQTIKLMASKRFAGMERKNMNLTDAVWFKMQSGDQMYVEGRAQPYDMGKVGEAFKDDGIAGTFFEHAALGLASSSSPLADLMKLLELKSSAALSKKIGAGGLVPEGKYFQRVDDMEKIPLVKLIVEDAVQRAVGMIRLIEKMAALAVMTTEFDRTTMDEKWKVFRYTGVWIHAQLKMEDIYAAYLKRDTSEFFSTKVNNKPPSTRLENDGTKYWLVYANIDVFINVKPVGSSTDAEVSKALHEKSISHLYADHHDFLSSEGGKKAWFANMAELELMNRVINSENYKGERYWGTKPSDR